MDSSCTHRRSGGKAFISLKKNKEEEGSKSSKNIEKFEGSATLQLCFSQPQTKGDRKEGAAEHQRVLLVLRRGYSAALRGTPSPCAVSRAYPAAEAAPGRSGTFVAKPGLFLLPARVPEGRGGKRSARGKPARGGPAAGAGAGGDIEAAGGRLQRARPDGPRYGEGLADTRNKEL